MIDRERVARSTFVVLANSIHADHDQHERTVTFINMIGCQLRAHACMQLPFPGTNLIVVVNYLQQNVFVLPGGRH